MGKKKPKFLIAVSGGADSMLLLFRYLQANIIVAHVNYNYRVDSELDQRVVTNFCQTHKIPLFIYSVNQKIKGNFEAQARKIRYDFFAKVYQEKNCDFLVLAHHKDDFLETAIMQKNSGRKPLF